MFQEFASISAVDNHVQFFGLLEFEFVGNLMYVHFYLCVCKYVLKFIFIYI